MKTRLLLLATILAVTSVSAARASQCAPRDQVVRLLADQYGEHPQGMGMSADNRVMEVFASTATGTWTITVSDPAGTTCLIASGEGYRALAEMPVGEPA